jgi:uncharacterized protein
VHIEELSTHASLNFLGSQRLGRMACVNNSQPYITPFNYVYHDRFIYSFATVGQKVNWLRANPLACVEVDVISSPSQWTSVIASVRYEELLNTPEGKLNRDLAFNLLQQQDLWWEPGYVRTILRGEHRNMEPVYFRFSIDHITGHKAVNDGIA